MARISGLDAARSIVRFLLRMRAPPICVFAHSAMFGIGASTTAGA